MDTKKSKQIKEIIFVRHAETAMNLKKVRYDNFGPNEYYPITDNGIDMSKETGKYLTKYGEFDLIISSPRHRCMQTADHIAKEVGYDGEIIKSDLLLESNAGKLQMMPHSQIKDLIINKHEELLELKNQVESEKNEFKKLLLDENMSRKFYEYTEQTSTDQLKKNYEEFLDYVKKVYHKRIIVVCHSGTIHSIRNMISHIGYGTNIDLVSGSCENTKTYFNGNCTIMGVILRSDEFLIVIPPNNRHLENLSNKLTNTT